MEIKAIRLDNVRRLMREAKAAYKGPGKYTGRLFADAHGLDPIHFRQIIGGFRGIGHQTARRIEDRHRPKKLEIGWLDREHKNGDPDNATEANLSKTIIELFRADPKAVLAAVGKLRKGRKS